MLFFFPHASLADEPYYQSELIFPTEPWHNHGSSLVECPDGSLLACWFHGSGERNADDVLIQGARKRKGDASWSERFVVADTPGYPDCNPVLFIDAEGRLWFYWITVLANLWETSLLKYRVSNHFMQPSGPPAWDWQDNIHITPQHFADDLKAEWSDFVEKYPHLIPDTEKPFSELHGDEFTAYHMRNVNNRFQQRIGWMTRIHPMQLPSGKLLLPLYTDAFSISIIAITEDGGKTWEASRPLVGFGNIQPSLIQKNDGTIIAMMRENGPRKRIRIASSRDEGMTWSRVSEMEFPNPGSSVEVIRLQNGNWLLMYNDTKEGRHSLNLSLSDDEGKTWKWGRHLEKVPPGGGRFSYPSLIQSREGMIHATYSYHLPDDQKSIKHAAFNEAWIKEGDSR
ncbi:MAG: sialidase family protein [Candidatus Hinthialibacter sp.]